MEHVEYTCDWCGRRQKADAEKTYKLEIHPARSPFKTFEDMVRQNAVYRRELDLCEECLRDLRAWMKTG